MGTVRTLTLLLLFWLTAKSTVGQSLPVVEKDNPIYQLESRLMNGDKTALFKISGYFDSTNKVIEFLGYHAFETTESSIAKRIVSENCLFTNNEFRITDYTTTKQFDDFLNQNKDKIVFSKLAASFLITPLDKRTVNFEIRAVSETKKQELQDNAKALLNRHWAKENKIDSLVKKKNPISLLIIASDLFKIRDRFNRYYYNGEEFTNLLQYLTGTEIGVENEKKKISWHIEKDYYPESKLNLLIYFSKFYTHYTWDDKKAIFINPNQIIQPITKEELLFQLLNNENDSIAMDAFIKLTVCDRSRVTQMVDEYQSAGIEMNGSIPIFPYAFLKQLALLTEYCKANNIDFVGTKELRSNISLLQTQLSFPERRKLEDRLINSLTINDITAFEYWAIIDEESWGLTYSAGRILDIFYSKHFNEVLNDEKQLLLYLKKSVLFDNLGIIGICNNYLTKFINLQEVGTERLSVLKISDNEINSQISKAKSICKTSLKGPKDTMKINDGNRDYTINNIKQKISAVSKISDAEKMEDSLTELLSQISYSQIGEAITGIENITFKEAAWKKYSFLDRDFGFITYDNFDAIATRQAFLKDYNSYNEYDFYKNMLVRAGLNYFNNDQTLDYDRIFDALKYNVVEAFVGGGGGKQDNEVYAIIKLLELTHKTTLGYPHKLCNSNGIYGCNSQDRANYWMKYLTDNKLLKQQHNEPASFHYE